jgi:hypothetical protein
MKASLVIRGGPLVPNLQKARAYGVNELVFEADDPALLAPVVSGHTHADGTPVSTGEELFRDLRASGYKIRIMRDRGWPSSGGTPIKIAQALSNDITFYGGGAEGRITLAQISAMYDGEVPHDSLFHEAVIAEFFRRRPGRSLVWTLEGLQAGWISDSLVSRINGDPRLIISPQCYYGDMTPIFVDYAIENLVGRGIAREKIQPFLRADRADSGWYGIVYDHAKLP